MVLTWRRVSARRSGVRVMPEVHVADADQGPLERRITWRSRATARPADRGSDVRERPRDWSPRFVSCGNEWWVARNHLDHCGCAARCATVQFYTRRPAGQHGCRNRRRGTCSLQCPLADQLIVPPAERRAHVHMAISAGREMVQDGCADRNRRCRGAVGAGSVGRVQRLGQETHPYAGGLVGDRRGAEAPSRPDPEPRLNG